MPNSVATFLALRLTGRVELIGTLWRGMAQLAGVDVVMDATVLNFSGYVHCCKINTWTDGLFVAIIIICHRESYHLQIHS